MARFTRALTELLNGSESDFLLLPAGFGFIDPTLISNMQSREDQWSTQVAD